MTDILNILAKINEHGVDNVSQKELLLAMFYEQRTTNDKLEELSNKIHTLEVKNIDQDTDVSILKDRIGTLENQLENEILKKHQIQKLMNVGAIVLSAIATIIAIFSKLISLLSFKNLTSKVEATITKFGFWGF